MTARRLAVPDVAAIEPEDDADIAAFACARPGIWYEQEVEDFIRNRLYHGPPFAEHRNYEAYVLRSDGELVGAFAQMAWAEAPGEGGTELVVGALSLDAQGARLIDGRPLAQFLAQAQQEVARLAGHGPWLVGRVAAENERSLRTCQLAGLDRQHLLPDGKYKLVYGRL